MIKLKENNWFKVAIWNNELTKDFKVAELDSRRLYEITYNKGTNKETKDLIRVVGQELRGVECISILQDKYMFVITDFVKLYNNGCIVETDYILKEYREQILQD